MTREEAIKEIRSFIGQLTEGCQEAIKVLIPELRSEDERMLRTIIRGFENWKSNGMETFNNTKVDDILAYLEKQKINTEGDFGRGYDCGYKACLDSHGAEFFEKQKEQKPVENPKKGCPTYPLSVVGDLLAKMPPAPIKFEKAQKSAEWSEDYHWEGLIRLLRGYQKTIDRSSNNLAYESVESYIDWIKKQTKK